MCHGGLAARGGAWRGGGSGVVVARWRRAQHVFFSFFIVCRACKSEAHDKDLTLCRASPDQAHDNVGGRRL
jgi:hypothetical protein